LDFSLKHLFYVHLLLKKQYHITSNLSLNQIRAAKQKIISSITITSTIKTLPKCFRTRAYFILSHFSFS
jgi:hypothetical protein